MKPVAVVGRHPTLLDGALDGLFAGETRQSHGRFGTVDVYLPGPGGAQIHDLNPSTFPPLGLFWTIEIPDEQDNMTLRSVHSIVRGSTPAKSGRTMM